VRAAVVSFLVASLNFAFTVISLLSLRIVESEVRTKNLTPGFLAGYAVISLGMIGNNSTCVLMDLWHAMCQAFSDTNLLLTHSTLVKGVGRKCQKDRTIQCAAVARILRVCEATHATRLDSRPQPICVFCSFCLLIRPLIPSRFPTSQGS